MALWILQNQYAAAVFNDLKIICPDPGLAVDTSGKISYAQTMSGVGCDTLALLQTLGTVGIRGESSGWSANPSSGKSLSDVGGIAIFDVYPGTRVVDVIYDVTGCGGSGGVTVDPAGVLIAMPSDVLLFHELAHAAGMFLKTYDPNNREPLAIQAENVYRASRGLPQRGSWVGGCAGSFTPGPAPKSTARRTVVPNVCNTLLLSLPQAFGTDHTWSVNQVPPGERSYIINVNNQTTDTFAQVVVFYKRIGLPGVVILKADEVLSGQLITFVCGLRKDLESYVVGFFLGDDLVQQIPTIGNMTPTLASQLNPTDADPCVDSWMIS